MSHLRNTMEGEIQALRQQDTEAQAESARLAAEYRQIEHRRTEIVQRQAAVKASREALATEIRLAEGFLAQLVEHSEPEAVIPEPEAQPKPKTKPAPKSKVRTRRYEVESRTPGKRRPEGGRKPITETAKEREPRPVRDDELEIYEQLLRENGPMSQVELTEEVMGLMDLKRGTAVGLTSRALEWLLHHNRIRWTGDSKSTPSGGQSRTFRLATPEEAASAGLPVGDEPGAEFMSSTSHPPRVKPVYDGPGQVAVDTSGFEQGRHR